MLISIFLFNRSKKKVGETMEIKKYSLKEIETIIKKLKKERKTNLNKIKKIMFDNMDHKIISMDNIEFNIITMIILYCNLKMEISISIFEIWKKEYERSKETKTN